MAIKSALKLSGNLVLNNREFQAHEQERRSDFSRFRLTKFERYSAFGGIFIRLSGLIASLCGIFIAGCGFA